MVTSRGLFALVFVLISMYQTSGLEENLSISFLNDLRYDIFPVDAAATGDEKPVCVDDIKADTNCVGGLSRLMAIYDKSITDESLWLNAGNFLGGSNYDVLKFKTAAKAANFLHFNASTLGPELFQYGLYPIGTYFEALDDSAVLASNWQQNEKVQNSTIIPFGEECHIAVIGFMDKVKVDEMKVFGVSIEEEKTAIEREVAAIKSANVDKKILYIALGSANIETAKAISSIQDIDLVIFSGGNFSATDKPDERAFLQSVGVGNKTNWMASVNRNFNGVDSRFLIGQLNLTLKEECKISDKPVLTLLDYMQSDRAPDEQLSDFLRTEGGKVAAVKDAIALTKVSLLPTPETCIIGECSLGGLIADAVVAKINVMNASLPWTESVKLAVIPGGILHNVQNKTGPVTPQMLHNLLHNDEFIYTITLTGAQLKKMFQTSVKDYKDSKTPMEDLLQVSGSLRVEFEGRTVTSVRSVSETSDSLALTLVNLTDTKFLYQVAVPGFLLYNSDSYKFLRDVGHPELTNATVVDSLQAMVGRGLPDNFLTLPVTGSRLVRVKKSPPSVDCANTTGEAVILTLVVVLAFVASGLIVWKIVLPKYRTRRGSTAQLLP